MWARTWLPSPRRKRPPVTSASSQAVCAVTIGLRGKATATPVARCRVGRRLVGGGDRQPRGLAHLGEHEAGEPGALDVGGEALDVGPAGGFGHHVELHDPILAPHLGGIRLWAGIVSEPETIPAQIRVRAERGLYISSAGRPRATRPAWTSVCSGPNGWNLAPRTSR